MKRISTFDFLKLIIVFFSGLNVSVAQNVGGSGVDSTTNKLIKLPYNFSDNSGLLYDSTQFSSPLMLNAPGIIHKEVTFDPRTNQYIIRNLVGSKINYKPPTYLSIDDYVKYDFNKSKKDYWINRARSENFEHQRALIPKLHIGSKLFETIFGSNTIDIKPRGKASLTFGLKYNKTNNPLIAEQLQKDITFDFNEKIQMNVSGKIGENLTLKMSYDTEASFQFENEMKIKYQGNEDDIIQRIEAGNVSLPLSTSLIHGSQNLFGVLTELKFGKLNVTTLFSTQKSETKNITVEGGAQKRRFKVTANDYDENRHFFLSHYFRDNYEQALKDYPLVRASIVVKRIEVWVLNKNGSTQNTRNIIGLVDLAENNQKDFQNSSVVTSNLSSFCSNQANNLYQLVNSTPGVRDKSTVVTSLSGLGLQNGIDFEAVENARLMNSSEYTVNKTLGYISLNSKLKSDEIIAVAYEVEVNDKTYTVGELTSEASNSNQGLILKLLKGTTYSPTLKTWDLMMKNIYKLDAYNVSKTDFMLNIMYNDVATGAKVFSLPTSNSNLRGVNLLNALRLDRLNTQNQQVPTGDGMFDFVEGITINSQKGYIIFPVLEPFGDFLRSKFGSISNQEQMAEADQYCYDILYDSTKTFAEQETEKNKFTIEGTYKSAGGSEIPLNAINIPKGSVKVTAGGQQLTEGVDFTVDYYLGRVKILNQGILQSGTPINISLESNTMFSMQSKTLLGANLEYRVNKNLLLGASILNLNERPITNKVNVGSEPICNTIWGFNVSYEKDAPFLTKLVDHIPFIDTKAPSKITAQVEFAHLIPGHNKAIAKDGNAYIDDFEGATSKTSLKEPYMWFLSSTPQRFINDYNASGDDIYDYNKDRALMSWYFIDPLFYQASTPVSKSAISLLNTYEVKENQIFPNRDPEQNVYNSLSVLNLSFFPDERGPYNYNSDLSEIDNNGRFKSPQHLWAGIQRSLTTSDFEEYNVEFIEFWMMDPYAQDENAGITRTDPDPKLYIDLGNISEDVLKDGRRSFENGLPSDGSTTDLDTTAWGFIPKRQTVSTGFDGTGRSNQDVGYDGLNDTRETEFFINSNVLQQQMLNSLSDSARQRILTDPSSDNFHFYKGGDFESDPFFKNDIINRYRYYTGPNGNSPQSNGTEVRMQTSLPNNEDINGDNSLNQIDSYYEYEVDLSKNNLENLKRYIVDVNKVNVSTPDGSNKSVNWYQFKIPIREPDHIIGGIKDYRSIRFMRMYLSGFNRDVTLRFAELNLIRSEWRKYNYVLEEGGEVVDNNIDLSSAEFDVGAVNIEENGTRTPVNYVLPPGIDRVIDPSNSQLRQLNEQSITLTVKDLPDGFAKAVYKNINYDMRQYKRLKMFVHAEALDNSTLNNGDLSVFIRVGTDIRENYYEYEIPLDVTQPGNYSNNSGDRKAVWPTENQFDFPLSVFTDTKQERNNKMRDLESGVNLLTEYIKHYGKNTVKVRGNPNLAEVVTFMIGVRNKRNDDIPHSGEIWVNELRLSKFDESGGWAANARLTAQLADFGTVTVAGNTSKPGFGSLEQKLNERQIDEVYQYDLNTTLQLGKFFNQKSGIKIPMYYGYSETFRNPKYNPLSKDIEFDKSLEGLTTEEQNDIKKISRVYNMRKSINFTGVKFGKKHKKNRFYHLNNFIFSYSYSQIFDRDVNVEYFNRKKHSGSINYVFNNRNKPWQPFKKLGISSKYFSLIKDFNLNYAPSQITFSSVLTRKYNTMKRRNLNMPDQIFEPTFDKNFQWNRTYGILYNLTRGIKINYKAKASARIDEPEGRIERDMPGYERARDTIMRSLLNLGTVTGYNQTMDVTYQIPIQKIPGLGWVSATAGYNSLYNWQKGPEIILEDNPNYDPGNSISNTNRISGNVNFAFKRLFSKIKFIKDLHKKFNKPIGKRFSEKVKYKAVYDKNILKLSVGKDRIISHRLGTSKLEIKVFDAANKEVKVKTSVVDNNRIKISSKKELKNIRVHIVGEKERNQNPLAIAGEYLLRVATGIESVRCTYSQNNGSILNGFKLSPVAMGLNFSGTQPAPGWKYVLGFADKDYMEYVIRHGWFSSDLDSTTIQPYTMTFNEQLGLNGTLELLKGLKVKLVANYKRSRRTDSRYFPENGSFEGYMPTQPSSVTTSGNWSMTVWTLGSSFESMDKLYENRSYKKFINNRLIIAKRLAAQRDGINGYSAQTAHESDFPDGFPSYSQDVVIPAFISAYIDGVDAGSGPLESIAPIFAMIRPQWKISYTGLMQFGVFKSHFRSFTLQHSYKGIFNMGGYSNNPSWEDYSSENNDEAFDGFSFVRSQLDSSMFVTRYSIGQISISEDFVPLIEFNMTWKSNMTTRLGFNQRRSLALNTSNNNIIENHSREIVIGTGYRIDNLTLVFKTRGGGQKKFNSPVEIRCDLKIQQDEKYNHKPQEGFTELLQGSQTSYTLGLSSNYKFTKNLELRAFLDYKLSDPKVNPPYRTSSMNFGFSFNFRLVD